MLFGLSFLIIFFLFALYGCWDSLTKVQSATIVFFRFQYYSFNFSQAIKYLN